MKDVMIQINFVVWVVQILIFCDIKCLQQSQFAEIVAIIILVRVIGPN